MSWLAGGWVAGRATADWRLPRATGTRTFMLGDHCPRREAADLGVLAMPPVRTTTMAGLADTVRCLHASGGETVQPAPGQILVQLHDIKWPSARSSCIHLLFTCAAYQWAWTARIWPNRAPVEDG